MPTRLSLNDVWNQRKHLVLERVDVLEGAIADLIEGNLDPDTRRAAEREAHKLAGSSGIFGFMKASEAAHEIELALTPHRDIPPTEVLSLSDLVTKVRAELEQPLDGHPEQAEEPLRDETRSAHLLIVDDDDEIVERLVSEAAAQGMTVETAAGPDTALELVKESRFDVVLLDLVFPESDVDGVSFLQDFVDLQPHATVLVLTVTDAFADRVAVARLGGRGFLSKTMAPSKIIEAAVEAIEGSRHAGTKVLMVDDDPTVLDAMQSLLEAQGIKGIKVQDPRDFWEVLEKSMPDLLMLDIDMPDISGIELCRVVRNDPRWKHLPVLFLTAHREPAAVNAIFMAGADDYVIKPVLGKELLARIGNRLERIQLLKQLAETDPLTGVWNRRRAMEGFAQLIRLADRYEQPFCLITLDLDHFKHVNDTYGHAQGDGVLQRLGQLMKHKFRGEDIVARWGGEEFVVGTYGLSARDGLERMNLFLEEFGADPFTGPTGEIFKVTFSAGLAQYPEDGTDVAALYRAADAALYRAKKAGRAQVVRVGHETGTIAGDGERSVDVVVVEDDELLTPMLEHALYNRGYSVRLLKEGDVAAASLAGSPPALGARLVLLDIDLPGLSGLSILRKMADSGMLKHTKVIMLTARSAEDEVVQALELGARSIMWPSPSAFPF